MKLFGFRKEGNLGLIGRYKTTLICCCMPLFSREAWVIDTYRGGGNT